MNNTDTNGRHKMLQYVFILIIIVLGFLITNSLRNFIDATLGAIMLYVLFRPVMFYLLHTKGWKPGSATVVILLASFFVVLIPTYIMLQMFIPKVSVFFSDTSLVFHFLDKVQSSVFQKTGMDIFNKENLQALQQKSSEYFTTILSGTFNTLGKIAIMYLVLYYLLKNTGKTEQMLFKYIPMSPKNISRFSQELKSQTYSNAIGAPLLAVVQGLLAALSYWIFGLSEPLFWGIITGFFSFVPMVGTALIWLPAGIYQLSQGLIWQGWGILIFGVIIISGIDNIFRFTFQKKFADVHPLITVLGVIMGIELFGVPGVIFGPLLISYFLILVKIYKEEYIENEA